MKNVNFGLDKEGEPTPKKTSVLIDILSVFFSVAAGYVVIADWIPRYISDILSSIILFFVIPFLQKIKPYFAIKDVPDKIDKEEVTEMKNS